jgi:hypothetical protein
MRSSCSNSASMPLDGVLSLLLSNIYVGGLDTYLSATIAFVYVVVGSLALLLEFTVF